MKAYVAGVEDIAMLETDEISYNIYFAGCKKRCIGCHNPDLWEVHEEQLADIEDIVEGVIKDGTLADCVCIMGGEPLDQYPALVELIVKLREMNMPVWVYTGFTEKEIMEVEDGELWEFLLSNCVNIKVGGYNPNLPRGEKFASSNQYLVPGKQFTI